jgi:membrane associated rhomboid family serine protease
LPFIPLHDANPLTHIKRPYVAWALIAANVAVFFLTLLGGPMGETGEASVVSFGLIPARFTGVLQRPIDLAPVPESLTLLTSTFLHADIWHLAGNMIFLWVFADNVEDALGHIRFGLFYVLCAIGAGAVHILADPASPVPVIGASGAIAGVVGAYFLLHPRVKIWILLLGRIPIRLSAFWILGFWIGFQIFSVVIAGDDGIAWWAHIGGFVTGAILVVFMRRAGVPLFDRDARTGTLVLPPAQVDEATIQSIRSRPSRGGKGPWE